MMEYNWGRKALAIFGLILIANLLFFREIGTGGLVIILSAGWVFVRQVFGTGEKEERGAVVATGVGMLGIVGLCLTVAAEEKIALLGLAGFTLATVLAYRLLRGREIGGLLELVLSPFMMVTRYIRGGVELLRGMWDGQIWGQLVPKQKQNTKSAGNWRAVGVGVILGVPVVMWLVMMLGKADPVFAKFLQGLVQEQFLQLLPARLGWSLILLALLLPIILIKLKREFMSPTAWLVKLNAAREMTIVLGMVGIVLGAFLIVQWPYIFVNVAKEVDLSRYGVATYSEYVARGFAELIKVAMGIWGLSWLALLFFRANFKEGKRGLLIAQAIIGGESLVFILSIFRRVWLYQQFHGWTLVRIYGLIFLIWIVGMMVTMALRYVRRYGVVKIEMLWTALILLIALGGRMERLVVATPPTVNGRVDYVSLARLSPDGYEGWVKAYKHVSTKLSEINEAELPGIGVDNRREVYYGSLVLLNLSRNYDRLVWQYGSEEEVKTYVRTVLDWEEQMLAKYPEIATSRVTGGREQVMGAINESRKNLESADWGKVGLVVQPNTYYQKGTYKFSGYEPGYYGLQSGGLEQSRRMEWWDGVIRWNGREKLVYKKMKTEIPLAGILQAMEDYWKIRLQIITQPETERTVEVDMSFTNSLSR